MLHYMTSDNGWTREDIQSWIRVKVSQVVETDTDVISITVPLIAIGLEAAELRELISDLSDWSGTDLSTAQIDGSYTIEETAMVVKNLL